jgi:hypothetical protein
MAKAYQVVGPSAVAGHEAGAIVQEKDLPEGLNVDALLAGGLLAEPKGKAAKKGGKAEKTPCPACAEQMKRPPKFETDEELREHYAEKHPALAAPAGEEG